MFVPTEEIVFQYVKSYVQKEGHQLSLFRESASRVSINNQIEYKKEVCQILNQLSNELRHFILRDHQQRFNEMLNTVGNNNPSYQDFKTLADELFADEVSWFKIVTFLVFGAELVCRAIEEHQSKRAEEAGEKEQRVQQKQASRKEEEEEEKEEEEEEEEEEEDADGDDESESLQETAMHTIKCLTRYIDENLMQWICKQEDGWMSIKQYTLDSGINKGMRYYFRMATLAAFVGGLYFCSKFILQK